MLQTIEQMIFRNLTPLSIRHLPPPDIARASGLSAAVYRQLEQEFQAVPPITLHHLNPQLMAGAWSVCRESLIAGPQRALKEAVAVAVSESNRCPYCVEAHSSMLQGSADGQAMQSREARSEGGVPVSGIVAWARATGDVSAPLLAAPPFSSLEAPAVMGTVVLFHYINRMVNLFLDSTMMPLIGKVPVLRDQALRIFSSVVSGRITALDVAPGIFLTEAPFMALPEEFRWAASNPHVAGGLLRFAAAAEMAAKGSVDAGVRELVAEKVANWQGGSPEPGKGWLDSAVSGLPESTRPQARIALLAAFASWAADDGEFADFREAGGDDRALLDTAAWGAWLASRRIAGWLSPSTERS